MFPKIKRSSDLQRSWKCRRRRQATTLSSSWSFCNLTTWRSRVVVKRRFFFTSLSPDGGGVYFRFRRTRAPKTFLNKHSFRIVVLQQQQRHSSAAKKNVLYVGTSSSPPVAVGRVIYAQLACLPGYSIHSNVRVRSNEKRLFLLQLLWVLTLLDFRLPVDLERTKDDFLSQLVSL